MRTSPHAGKASNGTKRACSLCGFSALSKAVFVKVAGQTVCRDIGACERRREMNRT